MTILSLLAVLKEKDVSLDLIDNNLKINAPKGSLSPELINCIKENKQEIIDFLRQDIPLQKEYLSIEPVEKRDYYILSPAQKRLYIMHRLEPESTVYNMPVVFKLHGPVNIEKITNTFKALIRRHESLRTSFHMIENEPRQRIHPYEEIPFIIEMCDLKNEKIEEAIAKIICPFQLSSSPLLRVSLLKTAKDDHLLIIETHHIISDGVSSGLLVKDFRTLYEGNELSPLSIQYKDYSQWHIGLSASDSMKRQETYWLKSFSGEISLLKLPLDFPRPTEPNFTGHNIAFSIGQNNSQCLKELAAGEGVSLFMLLLAIFNVLMAKMSGQQDIITGTPSAGRKHADLAPIIGMFVNTLALRNQPSDHKMFRDFLSETREKTLEAFENQDYPFEELVDKILQERDPGRNPLFDVMFALQNMEIEPLTIPGLIVEPYHFSNRTSMFDLTFTAIESGKDILFNINYHCLLFKKESIRRMGNYFLQAVNSILANPNLEIKDIDILPADEKKQILFDFNQNQATYSLHRTIPQLFAGQVQKIPDHIAVIDSNMAITYSELQQKSLVLALQLLEKGICAGDIVAIMMRRSLEMIIAIMGILKTGSAYLPLNPNNPQERVEYMLKDSGAKLLAVANELEGEKVRRWEGEKVFLEETLKSLKITSYPLTLLPSDLLNSSNFAYIIYTSGSTGSPKGVPISHANLCPLLHWGYDIMRWGPGDHVLQTLAYYFDWSAWEIFLAITTGTTLYMISEELLLNPKDQFDFIKKHDITIMEATPTRFQSLLTGNPKPGSLDTLKCLCIGAEKLTVNLVKDARELISADCRVFNLYGPTEATIISAALEIDMNALEKYEYLSSIPIGRMIGNGPLLVLNQYLKLCPVNVIGELYITGNGVACGYLNNPELTAEKFIENRSYRSYKTYILYKTGDLTRWLPDGNIEFLGRIDQQVKIRGFRIELGEIENCLQAHQDIKEAAVIQEKDTSGELCLQAYIVFKGTGENTQNTQEKDDQLRQYLSKLLPGYMIPAHFHKVNHIPLTANGKINRRALAASGEILKTRTSHIAPQSQLEKTIAQVWCEILGVENIGIHDHFFDNGGNSLSLIRLSSRLSQTLQIDIPVVILFKHPTISALANYLQPGKQEITAKNGNYPQIETREIAVIGMAGRFPGAANIHEFWHNLKNSIHAISFFSDHELAESGIDSELLQTPNYVKAAGILEDKDRFDAAFFNYTHGEARVMDPQMRVFHECAWHALEDAAYNPEEYELPIGLYAGAGDNLEWKIRVHISAADHVMGAFEVDQLTDSRFIPARVSYKLNLKGPALYIHTACSTSLAAIHIAYHALLAGECAMALAGGVSISGVEKSGYLYQEGMVMSPDGYCRAFDAAAQGTVGGEGGAVVVLKPLVNALEDGDHIYALIKASAMNNDGARRVGFTAPSVDGQADAISRAHQIAGIPVESIGYIETHGTGTTLGDPIEIEALCQAFHANKKEFCAIGSVKSNIGHLDCAAGIAGFIKTVLSLKHRQIPPTLHFGIPNPQFNLIDSPFYVNVTLTSWDCSDDNSPLRAGVSSFGIGGTNIHLILEEWPEKSAINENKNKNNREHLLILSAKTSSALNKMEENLLAFLKENPDINITDVAYTLQVGRQIYPYRWMLRCSTLAEAMAALDSPGPGEIVAFEKGDRPIWAEKGDRPHRLSLPTYPFEGERFWLKGGTLKPGDLQPQIVPQSVRRQEIADWFYVPRWTPILPIGIEGNRNGLCLLVLGYSHPFILQLVERLKVLNHGTVVIANMGETFQKISNLEYILDPAQENHYFQLLTQLRKEGLFPQRIIHTWNMSEPAAPITPIETAITAAGFYSLLYLARSIDRQDFKEEISIDILSSGVQDVLGNEPLVPLRAAILGPLKVIPQEYPYILCRSIDIQIPTLEEGSHREAQLLYYLVQEFLSPIDSAAIAADIAYRNNYRWIKNYEPIRLTESGNEPLVLKKNGVYLITGGIGGIGYTLALYLAEHIQARLILTGRSSISNGTDGDIKRMKLHRLEEAGSKVIYFAVDVADKAGMAAVVQEAEAAFGSISGVIHAAGVTTGKSIVCSIAETGENECLEQFRPKIEGTCVLAEIFISRTLDFCLLTSSLSPILGGLGFTAYSAANAFMDAFVYLVNRRGLNHWLSIGWADWDFSAAKRSNTTGLLSAAAAEFIITPSEGIETFKRILTLLKSPASQVVISSGDLQTRIERWVKLKSLRSGKGDIQSATDSSIGKTSVFQPRPVLNISYVAPTSPLETAIAQIWQQQFGIAKIGINDDFFALGGDSLKAITMISRIHKDLQARVKLDEFFFCPTIQALAAHINSSQKEDYISIPAVEKKEYYPLSAIQKRLYIIDRLGMPGVGYNMPLADVLRGELDYERVRQVFAVLIKRHESFRTSFHMVDDQPVQKIHDDVSFSIETLQTKEPLDFIKPFDLSKAPLLRVGLFKQSERENILLVDMHHIISDGISLQILKREFAVLFNNMSLAPLSLQYKDYACWQSSPYRQAEIQKQSHYWLNELTGVPLLNLPIDYMRPLTRSFDGGAVETTIAYDQLVQLYELARSEGVTLFILLLSAYIILLAKICNQEDIPVGIPTAGRSHTDLEPIIGMFVNTLVLRNYPNAEKTLHQFCQEIKKCTLQAFENQEYPFEELVEKLVRERDTGRNPLFDTMFVLQNQGEAGPSHSSNGETDIDGLTIVPLRLERIASTFDLVFDIVEENGLNISFQYSSQVFRVETIERFSSYYKKILSAIMTDLGMRIATVDIIPEEEKQFLLWTFNDTVTQYPTDKTLHDLFAEQVKKIPDHIALVGANKEEEKRRRREEEKNGGVETLRVTSLHITYLQLNKQTDRLAGLLIKKGVIPNDIVGIMMNRSCDLIIGILGILKSGGAYLPLNPGNPTERINYMLKDSGAKLLAVANGLEGEKVRRWEGEKIFLESIIHDSNHLKGRPRRGLQHSALSTQHSNPFNLAYTIYTSGSTGKPKGVPITHANVSPLLHWEIKHMGIGTKDKTIQNLAYYFDWSINEIFLTLTAGAVLYMVPDELLLNTEACIDFMNRNKITILHVTPTQYSYFINTGRKLEALGYLLIGAEKVTQELVKRSFNLVNENCRVFNVYGPTECSITSVGFEISRNDIYHKKFENLTSIPIGLPLGNISIWVLEKNSNLCPTNVIGELYIAGDCVAAGYLNNPELTAEKFIENRSYENKSYRSYKTYILYKTGDLARRLPDGNVEYIGRIDNQVKIRGFRIELGEIERQLLNHPLVYEALVLVNENRSKEKYLCAYVVSDSDEVILKEYLSQQLPSYMIPTYIILLAEFPLNPNGKVDKKALPEPDQNNNNSYIPPADALEVQLTAIWSEILAIPAAKISRDADFFQLGGHSLKATIAMSRIHRCFNVKISLADIFKYSTIGKLGSFIKGLVKDQFQPLEPVEKKEYYPVSSAQKRLYIQQQMIENNTSYNSPLFTLIEGELDPIKLENVFRHLIIRHENLRTSFHLIDDEPVQKIHPPSLIEFALIMHDTAKKLTGNLLQPFNLEQAPLLRVELIKKEEKKFILMVDMHHIVTDGSSMNILLHDFMALYAGETLPPLKLQYKDYSEWLNQQINSTHFKKQEEYWVGKFSGDLPILHMPTDFSRDSLQNFDGDVIDFSLDQALTQRVKLLASQTGTTLFHLLLAIFNVILSRYSGQEDIVVGTAAVGRNHVDLQEIIGIFINLLPLRNYPGQHKRFLEFLVEVKENTIDAFDNQDYPFDEFIHKLDIQGTGGRMPLLDVAFNFFNSELSQVEIPGLTFKHYQPEGLKSRFDLVLRANDLGDTLKLELTYASELFSFDTARDIGRHYIEVLEQVLDHNEIKLADIKLSTKAANAKSRLKQEEAQFDF